MYSGTLRTKQEKLGREYKGIKKCLIFLTKDTHRLLRNPHSMEGLLWDTNIHKQELTQPYANFAMQI